MFFDLFFLARANLDFHSHNGFYLSFDAEMAEEWMIRKSELRRGNKNIGALLIFEIDDAENFLQQFSGMDLSPPDCHHDWLEVIKYYRYSSTRSSAELPTCLQSILASSSNSRESSIDYLSGPAAVWKKASQTAENPIKEKSQFCIKSSRLENQFNFLTKAIFCQFWHCCATECCETENIVVPSSFVIF